jgi:transcriptional regulator with XRE-family HTH domain
MEETIKEIAERIKGLRDIVGISIEEMAKELKISTELYQEYENGTVDIPASSLYVLAQHFNVELTALLTGEDPRLHSYSLTRNGKGVSVERRKDYKYQNLALNFIHKKAEPFLVTVNPDAADVPVHLNNHPGQEFDYVLEGTLKIVLENHELILNEGDSLFYDSNIGHGMKALNDKPAKFLAIIL